MISNKKIGAGGPIEFKFKEALLIEDIDIKVLQASSQKDHRVGDVTDVDKEGEEGTRNFNTLPRNYSDPFNQQNNLQDSGVSILGLGSGDQKVGGAVQ